MKRVRFRSRHHPRTAVPGLSVWDWLRGLLYGNAPKARTD